MNWKEVCKQVIIEGGPACCQFAVTDACNAKCSFCSFAAQPVTAANSLTDAELQNTALTPKNFVNREKACQALQALWRSGVRFVVFTGGEPTLHPHLPELIALAKQLGMQTLLVTNGSLLTPDYTQSLINAGLTTAIISIDSADLSVHEQHRQLPGCVDTIRRANQIFQAAHIATIASVTYSRLLGDLQELPGVLQGLGFGAITFSFPITSLPSSYRGFADVEAIRYSNEELLEIVENVKALKKRCCVLNTTAALTDMTNHLQGQKETFSCLGGYKQFYLDWNLQLWRCCAWDKPLCSVFDYDGSQQVRDGCTHCSMDCYRDASVLQYPAVALNDSIHSLCCGRPGRAAAQLFSSQTCLGLIANLENLFWLRSL